MNKNMFKKIISIVTSFAVITAMSFTSAYAAEEDFSCYMGVIRDRDGNVVETIPFPTERVAYVDTLYTLPAGGTFTSFQYEPSMAFSIGFSYGKLGTTEIVTTRNRKVKLEVFNASSIGGTRYLVDSGVFSTNSEDNYDDTTGSCLLGTSSISSSRPYYNGVLTNTSSQSLTINIIVTSD